MANIAKQITQQTAWHEANEFEIISEKLGELPSFYILRCPYALTDKSAASSRMALNLADNDWKGSAKLRLLMQWIASHFLDEKGELRFAYHVSEDVNQSIDDFGINTNDPDCAPSCCVLKINGKIKVAEGNNSDTCEITQTESYVTCFFRHIRNAFAHGNYAVSDNGKIRMFDTSSKPNTASQNTKYTFGMVCNINFLENLKNLVENKPSQCVLDDEVKLTIGKSYQTNLREKVKLTQKEDDED